MKLHQIQHVLNSSLPLLDSSFRNDANETLVFARKLESLFSRVYEEKHSAQLKGRLLVPTNSEVDPAARTFAYQMGSEVGEARIISDYADDLPTVEGYAKEYAGKIASLGASFSVSIMELRHAALAGIQLESKKAIGVKKAIDRKIDQLICTGDSSVGFSGFATHASVPSASGLTGNWGTATPAQIQADIEKICLQLFTNAAGTIPEARSITLVVDSATYARLATLRLDSFNTTTVLQYVLGSIPMLANIEVWERLATANAGARRVVAYVKDSENLEAVIPQEFEMLPMQAKSLAYSIPCHARYGGVIIRFPKTLLYCDGV